MDLDTNNITPLPQKFDIMVNMETGDFYKLCREMYQFSDFIEITCTNKDITFKCQGDSSSYTKRFINSEKGIRIVCLNGKKEVLVQAIYELRYLVTFGKCSNLCDEMQLYLNNDSPLFIHYTVGTMGKMLIGLSPVDQKNIKKDNDYNEENDKYYLDKKNIVKD